VTRRQRASRIADAIAAKRSARVIVYSRPSGYWYAEALDNKTGKRITDATAHSRDGVLRELRGKFSMIGVLITSVANLDPYL
jgi:hypothetical protein